MILDLSDLATVGALPGRCPWSASGGRWPTRWPGWPGGARREPHYHCIIGGIPSTVVVISTSCSTSPGDRHRVSTSSLLRGAGSVQNTEIMISVSHHDPLPPLSTLRRGPIPPPPGSSLDGGHRGDHLERPTLGVGHGHSPRGATGMPRIEAQREDMYPTI